MSARLLRVLIVLVGIAIGLTAAYFLQTTGTDISSRQASADNLRVRASAVAATIADLRAGQFAYVARGQGEAFWMSHVASVLPVLETQMQELRAALAVPAARRTLDQASAAVENFRTLDLRVKEFVQGGNPLLAADLIFSDGLEATSAATAHVAGAVDEELRSHRAALSSLRTRQLATLGAAGAMLFVLMLVLALTGEAGQKPAEPETTAVPPVEPIRFEAPLPRAKPAVTPRLISTAQLCGELARVVESDQLPPLLERAAKVLDASSIIVWVAEPTRESLAPALAHGYDPRTLARMGRIHRDASNAAATAFRTSEIRTVAGDPYTSGAVIVPMITTEGCVGVVSAEMKGGSEKDESSQALASIFAAQLATLVATPAAMPLKAAAQG